MVCGEIGRTGPYVLLHVVMEQNQDTDHVIILRLRTEGTLVLGMRQRLIPVAVLLVQVNNYNELSHQISPSFYFCSLQFSPLQFSPPPCWKILLTLNLAPLWIFGIAADVYYKLFERSCLVTIYKRSWKITKVLYRALWKMFLYDLSNSIFSHHDLM